MQEDLGRSSDLSTEDASFPGAACRTAPLVALFFFFLIGFLRAEPDLCGSIAFRWSI